jgi:hypothetical protein
MEVTQRAEPNMSAGPGGATYAAPNLIPPEVLEAFGNTHLSGALAPKREL